MPCGKKKCGWEDDPPERAWAGKARGSDCLCSGEKMTEEEVETVLAGHEDSNGCINYEGEGRASMVRS